MSEIVDRVQELVSDGLLKLRTTATTDEHKDEQRELFRNVSRTLDGAPPWPAENSALLHRVRSDIRKALAMFNQGSTKKAQSTLEEILKYLT
jgi:hypothetical protein